MSKEDAPNFISENCSICGDKLTEADKFFGVCEYCMLERNRNIWGD